MSNTGELQTQLGLAQQLNDLFGQWADKIKNFGGALGDQTETLREMQSGLNDSLEASQERVESMEEAIDRLAEGANKAGSSTGGMTSKLTKLGGALAIGKTMFSSFTSILSGTFSLLGGIVKGLFNIGSAIVGTLMNAWSGLVGMSMDLAQKGREVAKEWEKVREEFGSLASNEGKAVKDAFSEIRSAGGFAAKTGKSLYTIFGSEMVSGMTELVAIAKEFGDNFSSLRDEFVGAATELLVMNKGLAMSGEALTNMALQARHAGQTMQEALEETTTLVIGMEKQIGVDGKQIGKNLDKLAKDMTNFGHLSKKELVATAGYAAKLGVSIEGLGKMFDKFENFEDAATGAAKLAEAFGMNVDAMAMMNAESPAEQMDMMRQAFAETGKSLNDLSRSEKKYLEELTGLSGKDLYSAFDPANADVSFEDMMEAAENAEEQMDPAEAMVKAADKMAKAIETMHKQSKGFFDSFKQGIFKGIEHSLMQTGALKGISDSMQRVYKIGYDLAKDIFGEPDGIFAKKNQGMVTAFNNVLKDVEKFFKGLAKSIKALVKGDITPAQFFGEIKDGFTGFLKNESVDKFGGMVLSFLAKGISYALKGLAGIFKSMTGVVEEGAGGMIDGLDLGPEMKKGLSELKGAFTDPKMLADLGDAFMGLLDAMSDKFIEWAQDPKNQDKVKVMFAILFGPAIVGSILSGLMQLLGMLLIKALSGGFTAAGGILFAKIIAIGAVIVSAVQSLFQIFDNVMKVWSDDTLSMWDKWAYYMTEMFFLPWRILANIVDWVLQLFGFDSIMPKFDEFIRWVSQGFMDLPEALGEAWDMITSFFGDGIDWIVEKWNNFIQFWVDLGNSIAEAWNNMVQGIENAWTSFVTTISDFWQDYFVTPWNNTMKAIGEAWDATFGAAGRKAVEAWEAIKAAWDYVFSGQMKDDIAAKFEEIGQAIYDGTIGPIVDIGKDIGNSIGSAVDWAASAIGMSSPSKEFANIGQGMADGVEVGLEGLEGTMGNKMKEGAGAVEGMLQGIDVGAIGEVLSLTFIKSFTNPKWWIMGIQEGVSNFFSWLGGAFYDMMPDWAQGVMGKLGGFGSSLMSGFKGMLGGTSQDISAEVQDALGSGVKGAEAVVSGAMPNIDQALQEAKSKVANAVGVVSNTVGSVSNELSELAPIQAEAMVSKVAAGLAGEGAVNIQHDGLSIKVAFNIKMDAADVAAALGEDAEGGSYFQINTERKGTSHGE